MDPQAQLVFNLPESTGTRGTMRIKSEIWRNEILTSEIRFVEGWEHGMKIFRWRVWAEELGWDLNEPPKQTLVKISPDRILYTDTWLWPLGYGARQKWLRET